MNSPLFLRMGIFNLFGTGKPKRLTQDEVEEMEGKAKESQEQLGLVKRYQKARNTHLVTEAEINHAWRLGNAITSETVKTINRDGRKAISAAKKVTKASTQARLNNYAASLVARSNGGNGR